MRKQFTGMKYARNLKHWLEMRGGRTIFDILNDTGGRYIEMVAGKNRTRKEYIPKSLT